MKIKLSLIAISTLKFIVSYVEEKEVGQNGVEMHAKRLLSGEKSSQRRHYLKAVEEILEEAGKKEHELRSSYNKFIEGKKKKIKSKDVEAELKKDKVVGEKFAKLQKDLEDLYKTEHEIEITEKTRDFVKECFNEWKNWSVEDDFINEELSEKL